MSVDDDTRAAVAAWFDRYVDDVHAYAARRVGAELARDVVADTFRVAIEQHRRYDPAQGDVRAWLFGIATNVLANRLADLTELGLLTRAAYQDHPTRYEYTLSPSGRELVPALLLLKAWGDRHLQPDGAWTQLRHRGCAGDAVVDARCADCGAVLAVEDIETVPLRALPA